MIETDERSPDDLTLHECIERLGEINRLLADGRTHVEEALEIFEEGVLLHRRAESILTLARLRVEELLRPVKSEGAHPDGLATQVR